MGGGTPLIEANRMGFNVLGYDINPMAYWIVRQEIEHLDLAAYQQAALALKTLLAEKIGPLYQTRCQFCGSEDAWVKYFLWVKTHRCSRCDQEFDLFPGYILAQKGRHPRNVIVCSVCIEAYYPVAAALLDAGLVCTVTLPCPTEMAASIHINGTGSSIIDTVFVCRTAGVISRRYLLREPAKITELVKEELDGLRKGGIPITKGDIRCIIYGHLIQLAVWYLRQTWDQKLACHKKLSLIAQMINELGGVNAIEAGLIQSGVELKTVREPVVCEEECYYGDELHEVSF